MEDLGSKEGRNDELRLLASVLAFSHPRLCPGGKQNLTPRLCVFELHSYELYVTAVSAGIQMEKALGLYKHLSFLFIYSLSDRFTKNL